MVGIEFKNKALLSLLEFPDLVPVFQAKNGFQRSACNRGRARIVYFNDFSLLLRHWRDLRHFCLFNGAFISHFRGIKGKTLEDEGFLGLIQRKFEGRDFEIRISETSGIQKGDVLISGSFGPIKLSINLDWAHYSSIK